MTETRRIRRDDPVTAEVAPISAEAVTASSGKAAVVFVAGGQLGRIVSIQGGRLVMGREEGCDLVVPDDGVSRRHAQVVEGPGSEWWLEDLGSTNGTSVNGTRVTRQRLADGDRLLVGRTILKFLVQAPVEEEYHRRLYRASTRDALTGLSNRRFFDERLAAEVSYAVRHRTALSLLMIDIDHFKRLNDTYGHPAGDRVLVELAGCLERQVRTEDLLARFGGEEFAVLVRDREPFGAPDLAERIRRSVEGLEVRLVGRTLACTVSLGVASAACGPATTAEALVAAADRYLYEAKREGRNRIRVGLL